MGGMLLVMDALLIGKNGQEIMPRKVRELWQKYHAEHREGDKKKKESVQST